MDDQSILGGASPYDPRTVYASSSNKYGVGESGPRTKFPEAILGAMSEIVQAHPELGYKNTSAFIRDAVVHRLHYWHQQLPNVAKFSLALTVAKVEKMDADVETYEKLLKDLTTQWEKSRRAPLRRKVVADQIHNAIATAGPEFGDYADKLRLLLSNDD